MQYHEYAPSPAMAGVVQCIWTLEGNAEDLGAAIQPVLPDGRPELIVHFGDPFERARAGGGWDRQPSIIFAGQLTSELLLRPTGRIEVIGIRLRSDGAAALMVTPQLELAGLTIGVEAVSRPLSRGLEEARDRARSAETAVAAVQRCLEGFVDRTRLDPRVHHAVDAIHAARGEVSIERLAHHVGTTRRHLERLFAAAVGLSPKRLARIARFQHALQWLERAESAPRGAETAATCGYADQAHFIRDFRYLAGCAPGAHLLNRAEMTAFFVEKDGDRTGQSHLSASSGATRAARRAGT